MSVNFLFLTSTLEKYFLFYLEFTLFFYFIVVIGDSNGKIKIFNSSFSLVNSFWGHSNSIYRTKESPFMNYNNGEYYVATSSFDNSVRIWSQFKWTFIQTYSQHSSAVFGMEWLDADTLASCGNSDKTIKIWSLSSGQTKRTITTTTNYFRSLKLLNNKIHLATGGGSPSDINIYNINDGSLVSTLQGHTAGINDLVQISDSDLLASSSGDSTVRIWNLTMNTCKFILNGHIYGVYALKQISSDLIASGSYEEIKVWNITDGTLIRTLTGHMGGIYWSLDLINFGETLVSVDFSFYGALKTWDWKTGQCLSTIQTNSYIYSLAVLNSNESKKN